MASWRKRDARISSMTLGKPFWLFIALLKEHPEDCGPTVML
jgi:hypothetical protein